MLIFQLEQAVPIDFKYHEFKPSNHEDQKEIVPNAPSYGDTWWANSITYFNNAVSDTSAADGNEKEAAPETDNILKDVDMNQALESLKALYLEKHGREADGDMVTHWREELSQATHA